MNIVELIEEFREHPALPGIWVSNLGHLETCRPLNGKGPLLSVRRPINPERLPKGYLFFRTRMSGLSRRYLVHRLVLETFVGPCPPGMEACHFPDRDPANCRLDNLRWDTRAANQADRIAHGTDIRGSRIPWAKLTEDDVIEIRRLRAVNVPCAEVGVRFGISANRVVKIAKGGYGMWEHVPMMA